MVSNHSVPTASVLPHAAYRHLERAIAWLGHAFGFVENYHFDGPIRGAQMRAGSAFVILKQAPHGQPAPSERGFGKYILTIFFFEGMNVYFERSKSAGVVPLEDLHKTVYGELRNAAEDLGGHHWLFSRHARDLRPDERGATICPHPPAEGS